MATGFCPQCGAPRDPARKTCARCSYLFTPGPPVAPRPRPPGSVPWGILLLAAVGLLALAACAVLALPFGAAFLHGLLLGGTQ